jgi:hypothetical protein
MSAIIGIVARRLRTRSGLSDGASREGRIHRYPSQKAIARLHSVTRLTRGVPWLCGPVSRRVCYFVDRTWAGAREACHESATRRLIPATGSFGP